MPRPNSLADAIDALLAEQGGPYIMDVTNPDAVTVASRRDRALPAVPNFAVTERATAPTRKLSTYRKAPAAAPAPAPARRGPTAIGRGTAPGAAGHQAVDAVLNKPLRPDQGPRPESILDLLDESAPVARAQPPAALRGVAPGKAGGMLSRGLARANGPRPRAMASSPYDPAGPASTAAGPASRSLLAALREGRPRKVGPSPADLPGVSVRGGPGGESILDMLMSVLPAGPSLRNKPQDFRGPPVRMEDVAAQAAAPPAALLAALENMLRNRYRPGPDVPAPIRGVDYLIGKLIGE